MTRLKEYFHTDWSAMTATDWVGLVFTVAIALLMAALYVYVFNPRNRERLNSYGDMAVRDDVFEKEGKNG